MRKKIFRTVAILTCFSILTLSVPGSISAEKKHRISFERFLDESLFIVFSIFTFTPVYDTGKHITVPETNDNTTKKIKITDGKDGDKGPG